MPYLPTDLAPVKFNRVRNLLKSAGLREDKNGIWEYESKRQSGQTIQVYAQIEAGEDDSNWAVRLHRGGGDIVQSLTLDKLDTVLRRVKFLKMALDPE
jgi:hypothetical protein